MKKILVTGGFGFVGSHLLEALHSRGDSLIHVVDNLSSSPLPLPVLLEMLGPMQGLSFDVCSVKEFHQIVRPEMVFDEIYHLASVVGPAGVLPHMGKIAGNIVSDTEAVMELALRWNAKLVDVSTSEIYGGGREGYCSEEMPKVIPAMNSARLEYAVGKLAGETALINTTRVTPLRASIVRPFNISGPRQSAKGGFVLPRFVASALQGIELTVFGSGQQIRAFTHVKDVVDGIIRTMAAGRCGEAYNIGNPANKCTIETLADETISGAQSTSRKVFVDPKTIYGPLYEEANDKYPDAAKAASELGWVPRYSRQDVIAQTITFFRSLPVEVFRHLAS